MVNFAVINKVQLIEYLVKIALIILIFVAVTRFFNSVSCLEVTMPKVSNNQTQASIIPTSRDGYKQVLSIELGMIDNVTTEENNVGLGLDPTAERSKYR